MEDLTYLGKPLSVWRDSVAKRSPDAQRRSDMRETDMLLRQTSTESEAEDQQLTQLLRGDPLSVPILVEFLKDSDWYVRQFGLTAFESLADCAGPFISNIVLLLQDVHFLNRRQAADTLAAIGPGASAAIPALSDLLIDEDCEEWALSALQAIRADGLE